MKTKTHCVASFKSIQAIFFQYLYILTGLVRQTSIPLSSFSVVFFFTMTFYVCFKLLYDFFLFTKYTNAGREGGGVHVYTFKRDFVFIFSQYVYASPVCVCVCVCVCASKKKRESRVTATRRGGAAKQGQDWM